MEGRIIRLRKGRGLSQAQLAQMLHISPSAEGMYEQGRRTPSLEVLIMMSQLFSVSLDYLITGSEFPRLNAGPREANAASQCPCRIHCCRKKSCKYATGSDAGKR